MNKTLDEKPSDTASVLIEDLQVQQYSDVLDMYFKFNGTKFVKRLNMLNEKFP